MLRKKIHDKIGNQEKEIKEEKFVHKNLIGSKKFKRASNQKYYRNVKVDKKEKEITPPNEEETIKPLQKKRYDKIRNDNREIKEEKCVNRNLIGSKEKKRAYNNKSYGKLKEEKQNKRL